jgi:hypothetical protein
MSDLYNADCHCTSADAVVDVNNANSRGATLEHGAKSGHAGATVAVANCRGQPDDGHINKAGDDGGQCAIHAGCHNHNINGDRKQLAEWFE